MEDLRIDKIQKTIKRKQLCFAFISKLKKNWVKYFILLIVISIFAFPNTIGNLFGIWFNKLATSFLQNITF